MSNTKTKHTPGPWNVKFFGYKTISLLEWRGLDVCAADDSDYQQVQADARLIAAAPELLGILETLIKQIQHDKLVRDGSHLQALIIEAHAIKDKATGSAS